MNEPARLPIPWLAEYEALVHGAGLVSLGNRTLIELTGADRAAFLHNLCTNEIRKLTVGSGGEAFLTSVQGKTLGHVLVFAESDSLVLSTVPNEADKILKHLDHYLVCEQVTLTDRTGEWVELLLSGPRAESIVNGLTGAPLPVARLSGATCQIAGCQVSLRRADMAGPVGFLLRFLRDDLAAVHAELIEAGAAECGTEAFEAARIEWGFPWFGTDISEKNLPQEIARDALAVSFVKGCYLGQETVARIDALGHVNRTLVGIRFRGDEMPRPGIELFAAEQAMGQVTSAAWSPRLAAPLALGFARRGGDTVGARFTSAAGEAEVVTLPVR